MSIPKKLHQIWFQGADNIKASYKTQQETCQKVHHHWEYNLWDHNKIEQLIQTQYPEYWDLYNSYPYMIQKIGIAKVLIVHQHGGVYLDMDVQLSGRRIKSGTDLILHPHHLGRRNNQNSASRILIILPPQCVKPFDKLFENKDIVFSTFFANCPMDDKFCMSALGISGMQFYDQPVLSNGVFGSVPKHPFWIDLLEKFRQQIDNKFRYVNKPFYISNSTGIAVLTDLVRSDKWKDRVTVLHYKYLESCGSQFQECNIETDTYAIDHLGNSWINPLYKGVMYCMVKSPISLYNLLWIICFLYVAWLVVKRL